MRPLQFAKWLSLIVHALLSTCVDFITRRLTPVRERSKGWMTYVAGEVSAVAFTAKNWLYAMFARWRVDSYGIA